MHAPTPGKSRTSQRGGGGLNPLAPFVRRLIDRIDRGIAEGSIDLTLPDGTQRRIGGRREGPAAEVDLRSWRALIRLALSGSGGWYEAWDKGEWASPNPVDVFAVFSRNRAALAEPARATGPWRLAKRAWHWLHRNSRAGSRRNIHFHYDLGNDFYRLWLDEGMNYSSASFVDLCEPLEEAQDRKLAEMLDRTATRAGDTILEIGCGWGAFAEFAVREGRKFHGVTLSTEQKAWAEARVPEARITLTDYRDLTEVHDAVVSIEMAEAVGRKYWPDYLAAIARVLRPGGRAALQVITFDDELFDAYAANVDFIQRYIFPGGLLIRESEFRSLAAANGLSWQDRKAFGLSYAETLRRWRERFDSAVSARLLPAHFDSKFINLWRYYLMYCEGGFLGGGIDVIQVTLVKEG